MSADQIDQGCEQEQEMTARQIQQQLLKSEQAKEAPADDCMDCQQRIPEARQRATGGTAHCFECASRAESIAKGLR